MNALTNGGALVDRVVSTPWRHAFFVILFYSLLFLTFFSPVVFGGRILAIGGDGLYIHLPNFYSSKVLWDTMTFGGFPMMADPEAATWYPPAALLSLLPGTWNVFMILAYVAASSFMYGYLFKITESRMAALVSGVVFGLSGFMMAQAGNAVIIHSTVWVPLVIWSLEQLRGRLSTLWLAAGSIGVALCLLGGQPQIFFYAAILSGAYAIVRGWAAPVGRWRFYLASLLVFVLGTGLAAVQILPTSELLSQSLRAGYSFHDFVSYSLPPRQALTMIFPNVFGGLTESGLLPYFGQDNQTELTGYVGLLTLMLAALGSIATKKKSMGLFWLCVALLAFLLVLGDATPLARLIYHLPILSSFRVPARHFMEFTLAASVLAGLGVAAIVKQQVSTIRLRNIILAATMALLACLMFLFLNRSYMAALAAQHGVSQLTLLPWTNRAVGVPLLVFLLAVASIFYWYRRPTAIGRSALLLLLLIVDLGSFGFFYQWRYFSLSKNALQTPPFAERYKNSLNASNQRLMSYSGYHGDVGEMPAGLTRLWGVPNASGYNALILRRTSNLLPMIDFIYPPLPWSVPEKKNLDVMAARYLFFPRNKTITDNRGVAWIEKNAQFWLGSGCNELPRSSATLNLPNPIKSTALAVVSRLACSSQIPDGTEVLRVRLADAQGKIEIRSLLAGRDASEWAYDCGGVTNVRHRRANIFNNYESKINDTPCQGHFYVTTLKLDGVKEIKSVGFEWVGNQGAIILDKLSLIDEETGASFPIDSALLDSGRWRLVEETEGARVYENLRAMPRVWLAPEVVNVTPEQALNTINTGKLPDGREFDAGRTALCEAPITLNPQAIDSNAMAMVASLSDTHMEVETQSATASFLITSDAYYSGWRASVDGKEAPLYRADYAIRGVMLPPGQHKVNFDYRPRSFYLGATISTLTLITLGGFILARMFSRRRGKQGFPC